MCAIYLIEEKEEVTQQQSKRPSNVTAPLACELRSPVVLTKRIKNVYLVNTERNNSLHSI